MAALGSATSRNTPEAKQGNFSLSLSLVTYSLIFIRRLANTRTHRVSDPGWLERHKGPLEMLADSLLSVRLINGSMVVQQTSHPLYARAVGGERPTELTRQQTDGDTDREMDLQDIPLEDLLF